MTELSSNQDTLEAPHSFWPEQMKDKYQGPKFPWRLFLRWMIPGGIGAALLIAIFLLLNRAATRMVPYFDVNGTLRIVQADKSPVEELPTILVRQMDQSNVLGFPIWSENGRKVAVSGSVSNEPSTVIFESDFLSYNLINYPSESDSLAIGTNSWSSSGKYLALFSEESSVYIYDVNNEMFVAEAVSLFPQTTVDWLPNRRQERLLVTVFEEVMPAPNLQFIEVDGTAVSFQPNDQQTMRAQGVYSPNGKQIAYIASQTFTTTQPLLYGQLWIADSDGENAELLVVDEAIVSHFWDTNGEYLYFTRFTVENGRFELFRMDIKLAQIEYVGAGSEQTLRFPYDQDTIVQWSPNGKNLLYHSQQTNLPATYLQGRLTDDEIEQIRALLPVRLGTQLAPHQNLLATTLKNGANVELVVFNTETGRKQNVVSKDQIVNLAVSDGWSSDGAYLAIVQLNNEGISTISALDIEANTVIPSSSIVLNLKGGISWHPVNDQLMLTALEDGITTTLKIFDFDSESPRVIPFVPNDGMLLHGDGAWSFVETNAVAYVARETLENEAGLNFIAGSLWVQRNAELPVQVVEEGLNFAPHWREDGDLQFARFDPESGAFRLYKVSPDSGASIEFLADISSDLADFPFDRKNIHQWYEHQSVLLDRNINGRFSPFNHTKSTLTVRPIAQTCSSGFSPLASWVPTNRAVLIDCGSSDGITYFWLEEREELRESFVSNGTAPAWQK